MKKCKNILKEIAKILLEVLKNVCTFVLAIVSLYMILSGVFSAPVLALEAISAGESFMVAFAYILCGGVFYAGGKMLQHLKRIISSNSCCLIF